MGSLMLFMYLVLKGSLLPHFAFANNDSFTAMLPQCHDDERSALLRFKQSFIIKASASSSPGAYPKVLSWRDEGERRSCCEWDGIQCDEKTGHVVEVDLSSSCLFGSTNSNSSLFPLVHLRSLNLADNHFNFSRIPTAIGRFSRMTSLNLSFSMFYGQIPAEISGQSKLTSLDLSFLYVDSVVESPWKHKHPNLRSLVQNLTRLEKLNLNYVDISFEVPEVLTNLTSLRWLLLDDCGLYGEFPVKIFQMPNLQSLNIFFNQNLTGYFPEFHGRSPLTILNIAITGFFGNIPSSIEKLDSLEKLNLGGCYFSGSIPSSLGKLSKITFLDLSDNKFSGFIPSSLQNLNQLTFLCLNKNQLTSPIPSGLRNLTQVVDIFIWGNQLSGSVPESLSNLMNLKSLSLYDNKFSGTIKFDMFFRMKSLEYLDLSFNSLSLLLKQGQVNATVSKFWFLGLSNCSLAEFPDFIQHQRQLAWLELSQNNIQCKIPKWMWNTSTETLELLAIGSNSLSEQLPKILPWVGLRVLDLNSNMLQGPLPIPPPSITYYDVSSNTLSGEIPPLICNSTSLKIMDLSNNSLGGMIPQCLQNLTDSVKALKLSKNGFRGNISLPCTRTCQLRMIDFGHNQFQGKLPRSLANCTMLESLDLRDNQLVDVFPTWLGTLSELKLLILEKNEFYGVIGGPITGSLFPKLRVIDLSFNKFTGKLPSAYISLWNAMKSVDANNSRYMEADEIFNSSDVNFGLYSKNYSYSTTIVTKGVEIIYPRILNTFFSIDLSNNKFIGEIPEVIGILMGLKSLNLSNNMLTGSIPSSLGTLSNLESVDLSRNKLSGKIPQHLAQLTFLQKLDFSHNNLTGSIPQGYQFNTFENSSFADNPGLCGKPLS